MASERLDDAAERSAIDKDREFAQLMESNGFQNVAAAGGLSAFLLIPVAAALAAGAGLLRKLLRR